MTFCVGLTGTIGSGKSLVAQLFAKKNITIISADAIAKNLTRTSMPAYQEIVTHFGNQVLLPSLELNRALLRTILIEKPKERIWLEKLLHPLIQLEIQEDIKSSASRYCIIEIPLLYKKKDFPYLHRILSITSPKELTLKRIMQRDNCSKKEALALLSIQEKKVQTSIADDTIVNDKTMGDLEEAIEVLHQLYLKLSLTPLHNS
jgi:dephospho-CoA kinase